MSDASRADGSPRWESSAWVLAAAVAAGRELAERPLTDVLAADPARADVLTAAGVVSGDVDGRTGLGDPATAANRAAARMASLRQALAAAGGEAPTGWAAEPDEVLLEQGRASAATGTALATRLVPALPGLADRLASGGRVLDVGTGVGALAIALAGALPQARITGIDVLERAVGLARHELERAGSDARRISLRVQDIASLYEPNTYDLIWLPAPFLSPSALAVGLLRVIDALAAEAWLVVGTNPPPPDDVAAAVARWQAARSGGSAVDAAEMTSLLTEHGLANIDQRPTMPGGPILVIGQRVGPTSATE